MASQSYALIKGCMEMCMRSLPESSAIEYLKCSPLPSPSHQRKDEEARNKKPIEEGNGVLPPMVKIT